MPHRATQRPAEQQGAQKVHAARPLEPRIAGSSIVTSVATVGDRVEELVRLAGALCSGAGCAHRRLAGVIRLGRMGRRVVAGSTIVENLWCGVADSWSMKAL